jgi:hypothetical protein
VEVPTYVELLYTAVSVSVAFPTVEVETDAGLKLAVTPVGRPLTESPTVPENPYIAVTATVYVIEWPNDKGVVWLGLVAVTENVGTLLAHVEPGLGFS